MHNDENTSRAWHSPELRRISVRTTQDGGGVDPDFVITNGIPQSPYVG